jgi:hypothetical protein
MILVGLDVPIPKLPVVLSEAMARAEFRLMSAPVMELSTIFWLVIELLATVPAILALSTEA